ncbi:MAG: hypothetical protein ACLQO6_02780 [Desulfomonilaceae bacterium]
MTVVIVEQFLDFVKEFGDSFYIMNRGTVAADGITKKLTENLITKQLQV